MRTSVPAGVRHACIALACAAALPAAAADPEINHDKVVEARPGASVDPALAPIGLPLSLSVAGPRLYVGGVKGIGAIGSDGKLVWTLELPPAAARQVAADDAVVAFTSFDLGGVDRSSPLASGLLGGELAARPEFQNATVGAADSQGKAAVDRAQHRAREAVASGAVGHRGGRGGGQSCFSLYDKASGKPVGEPISVFNGFGFTEGLIKQWPSRAPVVVDDVFHLARSNVYKRVSAAGKELEKQSGGMLSSYEYNRPGPALTKGHVFFATSPSDTGKKPLLVAAKVAAASTGTTAWTPR